MFKNIKFVAIALVGSLSLTACGAQVYETIEGDTKIQTKTDTSLSLTEQFRNAGLIPVAFDAEDEAYFESVLTTAGGVVCNYENLTQFQDFESADAILVDEGFDNDWNEGGRKVALDIFNANFCPEKTIK